MNGGRRPPLRTPAAGVIFAARLSDPFGLCPWKDTGVRCTAVYVNGADVSSPRLRAALDEIAAEQDRELVVYGGDRTPDGNAGVGGAPGSPHLTGEAADVIFRGLSKSETASALFGSLVRQGSGVRLIYHGPEAGLPEHSHLDLRPGSDLYEDTRRRP